MMYAYLIKSRKRSGKPNLFVWFESKSDSRADREVMNILEDSGIETGRGANYQLPVRTDMPVFDDLPEESELDATWCDRYELAENDKTWQKIVVGTATTDAANVTTNVVDTLPTLPETSTTVETLAETNDVSDATSVDIDLVVDANDDDNTEYPVAEMNFSRRLLSQFTSDATRHHIKHAQRVQIMVMSLDTDDSYVQNLLLTASNTPELQSFSTAQLWKYTDAIKTVFPMEKRHELNLFIQFTKLWASTEHIDRGILVREWTNGNRITSVQRTDAGTNAGGGNQTDRNPDMVHSLDTLDIEVALALLPFDFNIYDFEQAILRRAKEMVAAKESPWKEWSRKLRNCPGILDYSRAAIFAVIRSAAPNVHMMPGTHQAWINSKLTETNHANPDAETVAIAMRSTALNTTDETSNDAASEEVQHDVANTLDNPDVKSLGKGVFSIEGLMGEQPNKTTENNADSNEAEKEETQAAESNSDVWRQETRGGESEVETEIKMGKTANVPTENHSGISEQTAPPNYESGHHIDEPTRKLYTHMMVDTETMGINPDAPIVSIGAVFFNPATGHIGAHFYKVICLESAMEFGGIPDAGTILWWMKQSSEARSALLVDEVLPLDDVLLQLNDFISENSANGRDSVQVWGNGASFDNVILRQAYLRTAIFCPWNFRNDRDVRTIVELGKAVGINPRDDILIEGDKHNALADATHQAKYVSAIWQKLILATSTNL
ncbi:exonuclease [Buttiauxella sp. A111]|uniref:exonuclease n=1 Tax=Buttiauxella sp. A111 TaxID=2563088 RepID=UPI0010E146A4|nr:exonuclease [Buttiauxella sp. A111]GDX06677.1 exonuclease [Buttiauxella sp. A111]